MSRHRIGHMRSPALVSQLLGSLQDGLADIGRLQLNDDPQGRLHPIRGERLLHAVEPFPFDLAAAAKHKDVGGYG